MSKTLGIENLKEAVLFGAQLGNGFEKALEDGKISFGEGFGLTLKMLKGFNVVEDREEILREFVDMDLAEKQELERFVADQLDLKNDHTEEIVEKSLTAVIGILDLIDTITSGKKTEPVA